ncbi:uncharacterized protein LOC126611914 [Malus sylvestris]|uniref:uncharacterized protein LOC126611914 n=1 Tax=Malus sylvestris TaxID=3752 RepID=UPI0021ACBDC6|nr:uncharacterized protein LOC126611914 [Malus sylvestris]
MASFHRKIHDFSSKTHLKAPHFLVVIPKSICTQTKLRIPNKFFRKYGDDLSNPVFLKLPTGSDWKIELRKWEGEVWFGEGWPKFSKFCSLDCCHSLVFGYEGNSTFRVRVFDKDFTEINYPLTMPEMEETDEDDDSDNSSWDDDDDSDCVEVLDNIMSRSRTRDKCPLSCPQPRKKHRTSSTAEFASKRHGEGTSSTPKRAQTVLGRMHASNARGKAAVALRRATAFKSDNPSFIVPMKRTYINGYSVWLPSKLCIHTRRLGKHSGAATLRVLDGTTWSVEMKCEKATRPKLRLQYGWTEFVRGNNLEVSDVCVLVLIDDTKLVFEVVIFRATETAHTFSPPDVDVEQTMSQIEETDEDDDSIEILDDFPTCPKTKKKSPIAPQPHKKNRTCSVSTAENRIKKCGGLCINGNAPLCLWASESTLVLLKRRRLIGSEAAMASSSSSSAVSLKTMNLVVVPILIGGSNYRNWRREIELLLTLNEYDIALDTPQPAPLTDKSTKAEKLEFERWTRANKVALSILESEMTDTVRGGIKICVLAKDYFKAIENKFMESQKAEVAQYMTLLTTYKFEGGGSIKDHIMKMTDAAEDMNICEKLLVFMILQALHLKFSQLKVSYNTQDKSWAVDECHAPNLGSVVKTRSRVRNAS